jgi:protein transport protein SEC24
MFLPSPSDLLVNLNSCRGLVEQLLSELPTIFAESFETQSAMGAALQAAFKMASPTGGRITVMQCMLPNVGPGALPSRETLNSTSDKKVEASLLGPATDFYKKMALDCSGQQVGHTLECFTVNLFATLSAQ